MKTYTIAYIRRNSDGIILLLSVVPDGTDARSAARQAALGVAKAGKITYEAGLAITENEPQDEGLPSALCGRLACFGEFPSNP